MLFRRNPAPRNDDPEHETRTTGPLGRWFRWFVFGFAAILFATLSVWVLTGPPPGPAPVITGPELPDRRAPTDQSNLVPNQDQPIYESVAPGTEAGRGQDLLALPERPLDRAGVAAQLQAQDNARTADAGADSQQQAALPPDSDAPGSVPAPPGSSPPEAEPSDPTQSEPPQSARIQPVPPQPPIMDSEPPPSQQYRIQIASVRTEDQAKAEWARVSSRHPDLLSRLDPSYVRFETQNSGTYYRVQGGPLVDEALASLLCSQLKSRKVPCLVISP